MSTPPSYRSIAEAHLSAATEELKSASHDSLTGLAIDRATRAQALAASASAWALLDIADALRSLDADKVRSVARSITDDVKRTMRSGR